jgi:hypothetical protein
VSSFQDLAPDQQLMVGRNGWGASAVDAFSTALVMEDWDVVDQILAFVQTINFDEAIGDVSLFETTIRYLGGLLSGEKTSSYWSGLSY